jgi:hypothetical protein
MAEAVKLVTPVGELAWVFITDQGKKDLNGNDRFVASVSFHKDSAEFKEVEAKIDAFWAANKPKGSKLKSNGIKVVQTKTDQKDSDGEPVYEDTDMRSVNFWTGITYPNGKPKVIKIHNAKGSEISLGDKKIGNGSMGAISGAMGLYDQGVAARGVTLYLNAIQLKKFVEFTGGDAGFENNSEEGDFEGVAGDFGTEEVGNSEAKPRL